MQFSVTDTDIECNADTEGKRVTVTDMECNTVKDTDTIYRSYDTKVQTDNTRPGSLHSWYGRTHKCSIYNITNRVVGGRGQSRGAGAGGGICKVSSLRHLWPSWHPMHPARKRDSRCHSAASLSPSLSPSLSASASASQHAPRTHVSH